MPVSAQEVLYDDLFPSGAKFLEIGRAWDDPDLTYYFRNGTGDISGSGEEQAIEDAFALWADVSSLTFTKVSSASNADIVILWASGSHGDGHPFDGQDGVLGHGFSPPPDGGSYAGDVHFDDAENWTLSTRSNKNQPIDLVTVAAHEIGHAVGLGHSTNSSSLIYDTYFGSHRYLDQESIDGIQSIYAPNTPDAPTNFEITSEYTPCCDHPVSMSWDPVSTAIEYHVYRCRASSPYSSCNTNWTLLTTTSDTYATDASLYMDDGNWGDGAANYYVTGENNNGESGASSTEATYVKDPYNLKRNPYLGGKPTEPVRLPEKFALQGNSPNPTNSTTEIQFALPEATQVRLIVYDLQGRVVKRLLNKQMPPGYHQVTFAVGSLSSGVYLYRLRAGDTFTDTGRAVVVK